MPEHDDETAASLPHDAPTLDPGSRSAPFTPAEAYRLALEAGEPPRRIGPYHLIRRVGVGGMGEVWEAEQTEPIQRRVAIKLVKTGMDTRQFIARFESERQALALMEHPSIARVIDAGATDTGRPYFVMEYVEGAPINEYCDRERLRLNTRIELFAAVCDAVQHAHQKGIIHRDLKPSNVLVTQVDGRPMPKIIDFGVAKATAESLADGWWGQGALGERTAYTVLGGWIGTPAYMSPEQARVTGDIDTRTDVYSLGVMLYELLTGKGPFDAKTLDSAGVEEIRRLIRDVEPPRPSSRARQGARRGVVGGAGEALPKASGVDTTSAAEARRIEPRALVKRLSGDLDWIVMKALEKEKERRYGSPADLAADLRRHLAIQPVMAGPPSPAYRARKFVRRHRVLVAAGAAVAVALLAAVVGTTLGLLRARSEASRANQAAATAEATAAFLADLFKSEDPGEAQGADLSARDILERGSERLRSSSASARSSASGWLADQPATRAELLETIGIVYRNLGLLEEGEASLRESLALRRDPATGTTDRDLASVLHELATTLKERGLFDDAAPLLDEAIAIMNRSTQPGDPLRLSILTNAGLFHRDRGDRARAETLLVQAVAEARANPALPPNELATVLNNLGLHYNSSNRRDQAEPLYVEAIAVAESAPVPNRNDLAVVYNNLGQVYAAAERYREAEAMYEKSLAGIEHILGSDHPRFAVVLHNLGDLLQDEGDLERAEAVYERSRAILEQRLGPDHPNVSTSLMSSAQLLAATGRVEEAAAQLERVITIRENAFGPTSPRLREPLTRYAEVLRKLGREADAARVDARLEGVGGRPTPPAS